MLDFTAINWWLVAAAGVALLAWLLAKFWPTISGWFQRGPTPVPASISRAALVEAWYLLRENVPGAEEPLQQVWAAIGKWAADSKTLPVWRVTGKDGGQ